METLSRQDLILRVRCGGLLEAKNAMVLRAAVGGPVLKRHAQEGDPVEKGQLLLEIDDTALRVELETEQENLSAAKAELAKAKRERKIQKHLFGLGAVPEKNAEDATANLKQSQFKLVKAQRSLKDKTQRLAKAKVYAPMGGFFLKDFTKKEGSASQDKELVVVGTLDAFLARVQIDEIDLARVMVGQSAEIRVSAFPDVPLTGRIAWVSPQAEREGFAKIDAGIDIMNTQGLAVKPNLTVVALLETGHLAGVLAVPIAAVFRRDGASWVSVVGRTGRLRRRAVEVGQSSDDRVEIRSGLEAGERVMVPQ
jgi:RND family efflux transporter MFP subunit